MEGSVDLGMDMGESPFIWPAELDQRALTDGTGWFLEP